MLPRVALALTLLGACGDDDPGNTQPDAGARADARPLTPTETVLAFRITDEAGAPLPAKVVLYQESGAALRIGSLDMYGSQQDQGYCDLGRGALGTWDGLALLDGSADVPIGGRDGCLPGPAIPYGKYGMRIFHGIDYEPYDVHVDLKAEMGSVPVAVKLHRAWTPSADVLSADLHVHAVLSGDSRVPEAVRVISEHVQGIQVIGASDHNVNGNYEDAIDELCLRGSVVSLTGNEVTVDLMHANIFPAPILDSTPTGGALTYDQMRSFSAAQLFAHMHGLPGNPLVQLNHPRLRFAAFFDNAGWDGRWPPPFPLGFDAVEIFTGWYMFNLAGDRRLDQAMGDFYTFMRHDVLVTATGNSDTHHLNGILAGIPRNYVTTDTTLDPFDEDAFVDALRKRRVMITSCPYLHVRTGDGEGPGDLARATAEGKVPLSVTVRQATFCKATQLRILVGGDVAETLTIPDGTAVFDWAGMVAVPDHDSWIGVDVMGTAPLPTELTGDWHLGVAGGMLPAAMINPILVDRDGDGRYGVGGTPQKPGVDVPASAARKRPAGTPPWP